jgi:hypothetical protein
MPGTRKPGVLVNRSVAKYKWLSAFRSKAAPNPGGA